MNTLDVIEQALPLMTPIASARQIDASEIGWAIEMKIPAALEVLARNIAQDKQRRDLLRPTGASPFTSTLVAGQVDLVTVISTNRILLDRLNEAKIMMTDLSNAFPFQWVRNFGELSMKRISDAMFIHCCLQETVLRTRNTDGALDSLSGDIIISANYIPTLAQLPFRLQGEFVALVAAEAQRELGTLGNWPRGQRTPEADES